MRPKALLPAEEALGEGDDEADLDQQADDRRDCRDGRLRVAGSELLREETAPILWVASSHSTSARVSDIPANR